MTSTRDLFLSHLLSLLYITHFHLFLFTPSLYKFPHRFYTTQARLVPFYTELVPFFALPGTTLLYYSVIQFFFLDNFENKPREHIGTQQNKHLIKSAYYKGKLSGDFAGFIIRLLGFECHDGYSTNQQKQ